MITIFRRINALGVEAENESLTLSDCKVTLEYVNLVCLNYDSDRMNSFWDITSQNQKSGARLFKQVRLFGVIR